MSRRVVLWRHGHTYWNGAGRFQGQTDIELDDLGREQAREAAARLAALAPDLLVSSDLKRAADTMRPLADLVGLDVNLDPRLRETYAGEWQGLTGAEIAERWPAEYQAWRDGDPLIPVGGGESRKVVSERMAEAITDAAAKLPDDGLAVLASHGGSARLGIAALIGLPADRFTNIGGLSNCSWSMLRQLRSGGWVLVEHNAGTLPVPVAIEEG